MDRRSFLKWLAGVCALFLAGFAGFWGIRNGWDFFRNSRLPDTKTRQDPDVPGGGERGSPHLSVLILSDTHINFNIPEHSRRLKLALSDMMNYPYRIDALFITGDLTENGREQDYQDLRNVLDHYKLPPFYANMGNHDYYSIWFAKDGTFNRQGMPNGKTDAESRKAFLQFMNQSQPYRDAWVNGHHFILLSQEAYLQEKPNVGEGAWYSDEQLEWLKQKMAEHPKEKPVFVMIHQPLPPKGQNGGSHRLMRAVEFREILKPYPNVFVFSGHTHQDFRNGLSHYEKETFHWFQNSAVNRVINRNAQQKNTSQGLYVNVYADRVVLRGRDFYNGTWIKEADWSIPLV